MLDYYFFYIPVVIGVARIFNWGGLRFNKSYPTAGTDPENFSGGYADLN